jgi:BMFP domain-containing protein YqiC
MPDEEFEMPSDEEIVSEIEGEESEAAEEPTAEEAPTEEAAEQELPKTVPHAALHQEREEHKLSKQALAETRANYQRLETRLNQILGMVQEKSQPTAPPEPVPDFEEDPAGYIKHKLETLEQRQTREDTKRQEQNQQTQQQEALANFVRSYQQQAAVYAQEKPDFTEAYQFLLKDRDAELQELGFGDPNIRVKIIHNEEIGIAEQAMREGVNPAERLYNVAKRRGYSAPKPQNEKPLEAEQKAAAAAGSLSGVSGKGVGELTAESLMNMSDEEFMKATSGVNWKKLHK